MRFGLPATKRRSASRVADLQRACQGAAGAPWLDLRTRHRALCRHERACSAPVRVRQCGLAGIWCAEPCEGESRQSCERERSSLRVAWGPAGSIPAGRRGAYRPAVTSDTGAQLAASVERRACAIRRIAAAPPSVAAGTTPPHDTQATDLQTDT